MTLQYALQEGFINLMVDTPKTIGGEREICIGPAAEFIGGVTPTEFEIQLLVDEDNNPKTIKAIKGCSGELPFNKETIDAYGISVATLVAVGAMVREGTHKIEFPNDFQDV
jgi:hypothetical protein